MNCSTPGLPVHHQLLEFSETHVHRVSDAIQPSHPLSSLSPLARNPSQHQSLSQWGGQSTGQITYWLWKRLDGWRILCSCQVASWVGIFPEVTVLNRVQLFATPWTVACQAPLSMGFSRQEHWSGLPFPSPGDLPDPGIIPGSPTLQANSLPAEPPGKPSIS